MPKQNDQLKRIDALFDSQRRNSEITVIDNQISPKCTVHRKRRDSIDSNRSSSVTSTYRKNSTHSIHNNYDNNLSKVNNSANYRNIDDSKTRNSSVTSIYSSKDHLNRRKSFTEGFGHSTYDKNRKRNSWNVNMFKSIEHPSAFPSLLRSDALQSTTDLNRTGDSSSIYGSVNNNTKTLTRGGTTNLTRRSSMSALSVNKPNRSKTGNITGSTSLSKKNFGGSSLYLRADSSGNTNLVRRDSIGTRSISSLPSESLSYRQGSTTRDYVSDRARSVLSPTPPRTILLTNGKSSILRKSSVDYDHKSDKGDKLTKENLTRHVRILENENPFDESTTTYSKSRRHSSNSSNDDLSSFRSRLMSMDSLDWRRSSIDLAENDLSQLTLKSTSKVKTEHEHHHEHEHERPHFVAVTTLEDTQAVRCAEFHPSGKVYAVGSNSKTFRICEYPSLSQIREDHITYQPTVLFKRTKHHKGSIYCIAWAPDGELIATGSNDKTIKLMRYDDVNKQLEGREMELTMHDGTVRDICFLEDTSNKASLLISGGAGDCKIYVTDCATATPFQALSGHGGSILSLYNWGGAMFVSGSQDKTVRFWDLRTRGCVNTITPSTTPGSRQGSPVAAVCVDPSGRLLVSGHEDSSCVLYDIRGNRPIQCFKFHASDVRSIRFSPSAYYLLTGGYDHKLALTDLQGDLTLPLPSVFVANHSDKVISGRWHPKDFSFVSTSADKTATLWALPPA